MHYRSALAQHRRGRPWRKFDEYRTISTLKEYVLVDSRRRWVEVCRRDGADMRALPKVTTGSLSLASIDLEIPLDTIYRDVSFDGEAASG